MDHQSLFSNSTQCLTLETLPNRQTFPHFQCRQPPGADGPQDGTLSSIFPVHCTPPLRSPLDRKITALASCAILWNYSSLWTIWNLIRSFRGIQTVYSKIKISFNMKYEDTFQAAIVWWSGTLRYWQIPELRSIQSFLFLLTSWKNFDVSVYLWRFLSRQF